MQYLLTEAEYREYSERPTLEQHEALVQNLRKIAMKAAGIKELQCGRGYCGDCIFSGMYIRGSFGYKGICPNPEKRNFAK